MAVLVFTVASSATAQTVTVWTDQSDYPPGDSVIIYGSGYWSGETVEVEVTHYNSAVPDTGQGHEPWNVVADINGDFETYWIIPYDDNLDETLQVTATGLSSSLIATTTFTDKSTLLYFSFTTPDSVCSTDDSLDVCAILEEKCGGSTYAPLEGRELIFFFSGDNCGVDIAQTGEDTVLTDVNGEACSRLEVPNTPGEYRLRVKFLGESKPGPGDPPNSACNPGSKVQLSNANLCEPLTVDPAACCDLSITCPADIAIECDASLDPSNTGTATASGTNTGISVTYADATVAGSCADAYTITRTWIATDDAGCADTCYQTITVQDTQAPVLVGCPANVTVECDAIPDTAIVTATDNCDASPTVTFSETETAGACANAKTFERTWTATDDCGNSSQCSQTITVEDTEVPVLVDCPTDVTVDCTSIPDPPTTVTATDNCDPSPSVTFAETEVAGTCPTLKIITRTWTATDACGNSSQCSQTIIVVDNTGPVCTVPDDQTIFQCVPEQVCLPIGCTDNCDPNPTVSIISGPGAIVNGEWCYTPAGDETVTVTVQCEDECGAISTCSFTITFEINEPPPCTVPENQTITLCEPTQVCLPVGCEDADGNLTADSPRLKSGPGAIVNGEWCYTPQGSETVDVTIECVDECGETSQCTFRIEFVVNSAPVIDSCPSEINVPWLGSYISETITATDADGDETIIFSLGEGSPGSIDSVTGVYTLNTSGSSVCGNDVVVIATDDCDIADSCQFEICVYNEPPTLTCSDPSQVCWGSTLTGQVSGDDPDGGPYNLFYKIISWAGPGTVIIDGATGEYTWETQPSAEFGGTFELCIEVSDNAITCEPCSPTNADTCWVMLTAVPAYQVRIEKTHGTLQGHTVDVAVYLDSSATYLDMGGFDFLIAYDASALTFAGATQGQMLTDCGWEYFTYRFGAGGNCGSGCPSGEVRLVSIAETNNGNNHPTCRNNNGVSSVLANLTFLVSNDRTLECNFVPIRFHWYECADNTISSPGGDTLYLASAVHDYRPLEGQGDYQVITNTTNPFPSYTGAHFSCDDGSDSTAKFEPLRCLEFYNGGVDIICANSIDARGDINLDGLAYTISDAVMYINYFVNGLSAFTDVADTNSYGFASGYEGSVAASDVNADGLTLTVSDMVYLIRVIVGDAVPYPKVIPLKVNMTNENGVLSVDHDMGAAFVLVSGLETPILLADNVDMKYGHEDGNTRIIIYSISSESFKGEFVAISGDLIGLELATYEGQPAVTKLVPSEFRLDQNYPNPFNPTTMISFGLPTATQAKLEIYNVQGQKVATLVDSYLEAGVHQFMWESGGASSGVYFYRLETQTVTETRKMILLK